MSEIRERWLFVTGRLAETALRSVVSSLAEMLVIDAEIAVLGISVAALMNVEFVRRRLKVNGHFQRIVLPGWCQGELTILEEEFHTRCERGPKDLFDLPEFYGRGQKSPPDLSRFDIEILAEINHAPRMSSAELLQQARQFRDEGADVIDLGMIPGDPWPGVGDAVRLLKQESFRVSIDSFDQAEVESAVAAGAELVLSCHSENVAWLKSLPVESVVIPREIANWQSLEETIAELTQAGRPFRADPILEPIGFGFATSLRRYFAVREAFPDWPLMMGVGNVTELSEVDSAGVNFLLAAICQEVGINSVLTTAVINWCRSSVKEFDLARRLMRHSLVNHVLPKHVHGQLVSLRDPKLKQLGADGLRELTARVTDPNFRIFAERGEIHIFNRAGYWHGADPYEVFDRVLADCGPLTSEHTFYLGMEFHKARTALTLGKNYVQDQALRWGFLTTEEASALERRRHEHGENAG